MRTEGDSWDITTSVGSTALFVATARALEAQKSDPLVVDPYAEAFCRAVGGSWADVLDGKLPDHKLKSTDFGEHFVNFQGARTKYFDEYFRRAAADGNTRPRRRRSWQPKRPTMTTIMTTITGANRPRWTIWSRRYCASSAVGA